MDNSNHTQDHDQIDYSTVKELMNAFIRFKRKQMEASNDHKVSEARTLIFLSESPEEGMQVIELSKKMYVTSPFITQIINKLEKKGLIIRKNDPNDRRVVRVTLTDAGKEAAYEIKKSFHKRFKFLAEHLGAEDSRQLAQLLHKTFDFFDKRSES